MTATQQQTSPVPSQSDRHSVPVDMEPVPPVPEPRGRPRSAEGEEAYLRSVMEQAKIDIAAGW